MSSTVWSRFLSFAFRFFFPGLEFVLHLFDSARSVLESASANIEEKTALTSESNRVLEDRMMALEQDHRRLNKFVEWRAAVDCELADFHENIRNESWFVILGLPKIDLQIGPDLTLERAKKLWQEKAKSDVNGILSLLMGHEYPIVVVQNITSKAKDAVCRYQVLLNSVTESKSIRDKFGSFFVGGKGDTRPEELKPISIQIRITPGTQLRISLLKLMAKRYQASNPGGQAVVISYEARPRIKIFPPEGASDRRVQDYHFIDAVRYLPTNFSQSELRPILEKVNAKLKGTLKQHFIVVSDDMIPHPKFSGKGKFSKSTKGSSGHGSGASGQGGPGASGKGGSGSKAPRSESRGRGSKRGPSVSPSDSSKSKSSKQ